MDAETWQTLGTIAVLLVVGGYNAWRTMRAERVARKARDHAAAAAILSTPTGNGFAQEVRDALSSIESKVDDVSTKADATNKLVVDHLAAHAHHDLSPRPRQ